MPTIIQTNTITIGIPINLGGVDNVSVIVAQGVLASSSNNGIRAISGTGLNQGAFISGHVAAKDASVVQLEGAGSTVAVSATGLVESLETDGGGTYAVNLLGTATVSNQGIIRGEAGVFGNSELTVLNTGTIAGSLSFAIFANGSSTINNSGIIANVGPNAAIFGNGLMQLSNTGSIIGSIVAGGLADRITNSGLIEGRVTLGDGADLYDGRLGRISGDIYGGANNDTILGGMLGEALYGVDDSDSIRGGDGDDSVFGGNGSDYLSGDAGVDHLWGGAGADQHDGGNDPGIDYARYDEVNHGDLAISLLTPATNTGAAAGDSYFGIEGLVGGVGNDTITGDNQNNILFGGGGADLVYGGAGNEYLFGDAGADNLWGGTGADQHFGGNGVEIDYARYDETNHGNLVISLLMPNTNTGAAAGDTYVGIEGLVGGAGNDVIVGDTGANFLFGSGGNDFIDGREGSDYLNGGGGADDFRFATALGAGNVDTIADFQVGVDDMLLVQGFFAAIGPGLTANEFRIGATALDADDFIIYNSATGALIYDSNGNVGGGATQFATLSAGLALTIADFVMV